MRHPYYKLAAYYAALIGVGLIVGTLGPVLGDLAAQTGSTLRQVSVLLAMRPLGYLVGTLGSGRILERRAGHPVLALAALAAAGFLALVPMAHSLQLLSGLILCMGLAQGMIDVGSNTLIVWAFHGRVGPFLSGLHFSFGVGAFIAPLVVAWALRHGGSAWAFWTLSLYLIPVALLFWRVPSPAHEDEAPLAVSAAPVAAKGLALFFLAFFFLYGGTEAGFGAWIYHYALVFDPQGLERAALLTSLFWGLLGLGRLGGIPILARFKPERFLALIVPASLLSFAAAVLWPATPWALWAATIGAGLSMACIFPTLLVYAGPLLSGGGRVSSRMTSFFFIGSASGSICLPWLMGQAFDPLGARAALSIPVLGAAAMTLLFFIIRRRA